MTMDRARTVRMELVTLGGETIVPVEKVPLQDGEAIDSMYMSRKALCDFYEEQMEDRLTPASCSRCTLRRP